MGEQVEIKRINHSGSQLIKWCLGPTAAWPWGTGSAGGEGAEGLPRVPPRALLGRGMSASV